MDMFQMALFNSQIAEAVKAVAPVTNLSIAEPADSSTWKLSFADGTPQDQIDAAYALLPSIKFVEEKPKPKPDDVLALLVAKGVITQKDVDDIPVKPIIAAEVVNV